MNFELCLIFKNFEAVTFTSINIFIIIDSYDLSIEAATITTLYFVVLVTFITEVMLAWFGDE